MNKTPTYLELARELEVIKQQLPLQIQFMAARANMYHQYFKDLTKEGFTENQAMEIIKARGLD